MTDFDNPVTAATKGDRVSRRDLLKGGGGLVMGSAAALAVAARADAASQSGQEFVGSWLVTANALLALWTVSADGSLLQTIVPFAGENDGTTGHGVWATTGPGEFSYTSVGVRIDQRRNAIGTTKIRGTITMGAAADTFSARSEVDRFDLDGNLIRRASPTLEGSRITLEVRA
jgi:hypothetical protein